MQPATVLTFLGLAAFVLASPVTDSETFSPANPEAPALVGKLTLPSQPPFPQFTSKPPPPLTHSLSHQTNKPTQRAPAPPAPRKHAGASAQTWQTMPAPVAARELATLPADWLCSLDASLAATPTALLAVSLL